MEVISTIPEPPRSKAVEVITTIPDPTKFTFRSFAKEVYNSPKKSTIALLGVALIVSIVLFGGFIVSQNLAAHKELKLQDQKYSRDLKQKEENNKNNAINLKNTQDTTRRNDLEQIKRALENYYFRNDYYPGSLSDLIPGYLSTIPSDPETNEQYYFLASLDQKTYILRAILSNGNEIELENN